MKLYSNAEVPAGSSLQLHLKDEHGLDVLPGYGRADGGQVADSGLDLEVAWRDHACLPAGRSFRIRYEMTGETKVFALYLRAC